MIDIHAHILPGVDDGSPDMEDSLEMARMALDSGVDTIVATPHSNQMGRFENFASSDLSRGFAELREALKWEEIPLTLLEGMEIFSSEDMGEKITDGRLTGINGSRYYLVEFAFGEEPDWMRDRLEEVLSLHRIPVVAHPERYFCVQDYPEMVYDWVQMGCLPQINKGSILGKFGREAWKAAGVLLQNGLAACVASDAHSPYVRTTHMAEVRETLFRSFGYEYTEKLLHDNPSRIIRNRHVEIHGRRPERRETYFW